jgi:hypothetical protein
VMAQPRSEELSKLGGESSRVKLSQRIFIFKKISVVLLKCHGAILYEPALEILDEDSEMVVLEANCYDRQSCT